MALALVTHIYMRLVLTGRIRWLSLWLIDSSPVMVASTQDTSDEMAGSRVIPVLPSFFEVLGIRFSLTFDIH